MAKAPLEGIRVLDLTWVLAGPTGASLLAMLGAEVIKVETRARPDSGRRLRLSSANQPPLGDAPKTPHFQNLNHSKLAVTVNLKAARGVELFKRMVAVSDIVMESFRPGTMKGFGVGYEELQAVNPGIVMMSISGAGQIGKESRYASYAAIAGALGGLAHLTSYPGGVPTEYRGSIDLRTGVVAVFPIVAALYRRQQTGEGQHIDLSAREAVSCYLGDSIMDFTMNGRVRGPVGNRDEAMAPHNVYRCRSDPSKETRDQEADRESWVSIAVANDEEWGNLCGAMGRPELADDPRFSSEQSRWRHQEELDAIIGEWTGHLTGYEVMERLQAVGVASVPSFRSDQLYHDPHVNSRELLSVTQTLDGEELEFMNLPWKMQATPGRRPSSAPGLGQHNHYVFSELLKLPDAEIEALAEEGVI